MLVFLTDRSLYATWLDLREIYGGRLQRGSSTSGVLYQGPGEQSQPFRIVTNEMGERALQGLRIARIETLGQPDPDMVQLAEAMIR